MSLLNTETILGVISDFESVPCLRTMIAFVNILNIEHGKAENIFYKTMES